MNLPSTRSRGATAVSSCPLCSRLPNYTHCSTLKTSIMNLANHLSGFQNHQTQPWCTRTPQRFVTTWDFRKGTIHTDANWNFLCRWIIWWSSVTLAALCAARRLLLDFLICLEKVKNRWDWALISEFPLYRLLLWQYISIALTVCNHLQILKEKINGVGWGGLRKRRGWEGGGRDGCKCGIM